MKNELSIKGFSEITEKEQMDCNGGGVASAICGGIIGAAVGGFVASVNACFSKNQDGPTTGKAILNSMKEGFAGGVITGALFPLL